MGADKDNNVYVKWLSWFHCRYLDMKYQGNFLGSVNIMSELKTQCLWVGLLYIYDAVWEEILHVSSDILHQCFNICTSDELHKYATLTRESNVFSKVNLIEIWGKLILTNS